MKIGFTGTQTGMTQQQLNGLSVLFKSLTAQLPIYIPDLAKEAVEFHHGDCIGSDLQAHYLFIAMIGGQINSFARAYIHPPKDEKRRAFCKDAYFVYPSREFLARDRDIVDETQFIIATPKGNKEETRSGTWYTVRYARKKRRPIIIINPDGTERRERWNRHASLLLTTPTLISSRAR